MKKYLGWIWIFLILLHGTVIAGKGRLKIGIHTFPLSVNPVYVTDETSQAVINKIFDSLFFFDERGDIQNGLVEKFRLNTGQSVIRIDLKKNRFFSDGKELDSADVLATFNLLRNEKFNYPYRSMLTWLGEMKVIDRYGVKIILKKKTALWKNLLTFKILNSREIDSIEPKSFRNEILSGTGPYRLTEIREPVKLVLSSNPYYPEKSLYSPLEYMVVSDTYLKPLKLVNGEIDICELQPEDAVAYPKIGKWQRKFRLLRYMKFGYTYLIFNLNNASITKNVRCIFYNELVNGNFIKRFLKARGEPVKTPFLLLNSEEKPEDRPVNKITGRLNLSILTNSESRLRKEFVLFLKQQMEALGIILEPQFLEYHSFIDRLKSGKFDVGVSGFLLDIDYDLKDVFSSQAAFNYGHFSNSSMDELLEAGLSEMDPEKRKTIYRQANRLWKAELPLIPLFNLFYYMGVSRKISVPRQVCSLMGSSGDFLINIQDWKTE